MQQRKSVNFNDWKEAYQMGFDGFILECGEKTAQEYIDKFSVMSEVSGSPVFRSDGVHVKFKRDKPLINKVKPLPIKLLSIGFIAGFILTFIVTYMVFTFENKPAPTIQTDPFSNTVIVQNNIIPRKCYMTYTKLEAGYSVWIMEINGNKEFYIEIEDYDSFLNEYLEKR